MNQKPHLVDQISSDERGHALSSCDVQQTVIQQLRMENARLRANLANINQILIKLNVANSSITPPPLL